MLCLRAASLLALVSIASPIAACGGGGGFPDAAGEPDAAPTGTLSLDWSLLKMADGTPVGCDQVGAVTVTLLLRNLGFQGGFTEVFSCNTKTGTTGPIPLGTYDVNFELTGVSGLITTSPEQRGLVVTKDQNTPLTPVAFTVNATGMLDLRLDSLNAVGNCAGGAGITNMRITLNHASGGACETATVMVGVTPYTINCMTPANIACIDKTTAITSASFPSDNYQIHVRGDAPSNCYVNDDSIRVPPNGLPLMRTLNLAATGAACL